MISIKKERTTNLCLDSGCAAGAMTKTRAINSAAPWPAAESRNVYALRSVQKASMGVPSIYRMTLTCGFIPEFPAA